MKTTATVSGDADATSVAGAPRRTPSSWWRLDPGGLVVGFVFGALAVTPSLLPRPALLQGVVTGIAFALGYAAGVLIWWALCRLVSWRPPAPAVRWAWLGVGLVLLIAVLGLGVLALGWQNELRRLVEMPVLDGVDASLFLVGAVPTTVLLLAAGRGIRSLHRRIASRQGAGLAALATGAIVAGSLAAIVGLGMFALDRVYEARNGPPADWVSEPASDARSAGSDSEVRWNDLGRHGSAFVGGGPTAAGIEEVTGASAIEPVRVYASLAAGDTAEERAAIAVSELERTGAFDRSVLVVATATGSGWLEPQTVDAIEYLHGGDTAIVATQYAYTPSWVSFVFDPDAPVEEARVLFDAVHEAWSTLPAGERPMLISYGLSLGAHGSQAVFPDVATLRERTDGAMFVGTPNGSELWRALTAAREPGSPIWRPVLDGGREVRWLSREAEADAASVNVTADRPWDAPRVAYLQHATDPVTWLGPELFWAEPEWLSGPRADDVSPSMRWIPVVTGLQVVIDMLMGESVPARHGHNYGDVVVGGWRAVTGDAGLDEAAVDRVQAEIESYSAVQPVSSAATSATVPVAAVDVDGLAGAGAGAGTAAAAGAAVGAATGAAVDATEPVPQSEPPQESAPSEPDPEPDQPGESDEPGEQPSPLPPGSDAPAPETPADPAVPEQDGDDSEAPVLDEVPPAASVEDASPVSWIIAAAVLIASTLVLVAVRRRRTAGVPEEAIVPTGPIGPIGLQGPRGAPAPAETLAAVEAAGEAMIDAGYSVVTVQTALEDIARVNGYPSTEIVVFPTALIVSARGVGELRTGVVSSGHTRLLLYQVDALHRTVEAARTGALDPTATRRGIRSLRALPPPYNRLQRIAAYVLLSAGLAVLLGASWTGAVVAALLGAVVGTVLLAGARLPRQYQALVTVAIAFGVSVAVFLLIRTGLDPGVLPSLIAPLVTLLPGALLTTAVIELSTGQMMAGAGRLAAGTMQLVLLAVGIVAAAALVGVPRIELNAASQPLGPIAPWIAVAVFGVGIVVYQCGRRDSIAWIVLVLYVAYGAQVIGDIFLGGVLSAFVGALVVAPVAVLVARQPSGPPAIVSFLPAFWLLVPGALGLVGVTTILDGDAAGLTTLVTTVSTMVAIALGTLAGSALTSRLRSSRPALL